MSKTSASRPRNARFVGRRDSTRFPYNEWTRTPVRRSRSFPTAAMYWVSPRTPCSGPKRAARRTLRASWKRSAARRSPPSSPRRGANRSPASTSRPDATFSARRPAFGPPSPITGEDTTSRAAQGTSGGTARATPRSQLLEADRIAEVEPEETLVHRFSVRLRIRVHEVVQRRSRLRRVEPQVPPRPEGDPALVDGAEVVLPQRSCLLHRDLPFQDRLPHVRRVRDDPTVPRQVPPRPAVLRFRHVAFGSLRQADAEPFAGRDSRGPRQGPKNGEEGRAFSPAGGPQPPHPP